MWLAPGEVGTDSASGGGGAFGAITLAGAPSVSRAVVAAEVVILPVGESGELSREPREIPAALCPVVVDCVPTAVGCVIGVGPIGSVPGDERPRGAPDEVMIGSMVGAPIGAPLPVLMDGSVVEGSAAEGEPVGAIGPMSAAVPTPVESVGLIGEIVVGAPVGLAPPTGVGGLIAEGAVAVLPALVLVVVPLVALPGVALALPLPLLAPAVPAVPAV